MSRGDSPWANDTVSYTYANRLRTGLSLSQPGGSWSQTYGYDVTRRMTNIVSPAGSFGYQYAGSGPSTLVSRLALPDGAYITNGYDSVARLLSTELESSTNSDLDSYAYGYNQAGQRTNVVRTAGDFVNYSYDNAGELTAGQGFESGGAMPRLQEQLGYDYDAAGNLNFRTNNGFLQTFNVNNLNEFTSIDRSGTLTVSGTTTTPATSVTVNTSNAVRYADSTFASTNQPWVNGANTYTAIAQDSYGRQSTNSVTANLEATNSYSYDLNGNLLSDTNRNFAYDDENQLTSVYVTNAWRCDFVYDGKFRRRIEKDYSWQSGAWVQTNEIHFIYDGNSVIQERDANNNPLVSYTRSGSTLLARTDYGQEIPGSPTTAYYHEDGNANVTCLIYPSQQIAAKYLYGPFGETLSLSGPLAPFNTYRFASKEWNDRAGIYYFGRRYYDPIIIRFLNRDPLAEQGGINLYAYVANNPINEIDLLGWSDFNAPPVSVNSPFSISPIVNVTPVSGNWNLFNPLGGQLGQIFPMMGANGQPFWDSQIQFTQYPNGYGSQVSVSGTMWPGGSCNTVNGSGAGAGSLLFNLSGAPGNYLVNVSASVDLSGTGGAGAMADLFAGTNPLGPLYGGTGFPLNFYTNLSIPVTIPQSGYTTMPFFQYQPSIGVRQGPNASGSATGTFGFSVSPQSSP